MRSEAEMLNLVIGTAEQDARIRAAIMNGSRANPKAPRDPFQDYDIVYLVNDVAPFRRNLEWIERFGELMILQMPEDMEDPPPADDGSFIYLMQFMDGNRIDLSICPVCGLKAQSRDSQSIVLLDKDNLIEPLPPPSDSDYLPKPPDEKQFQDCCNEFWWVGANVFKGLWRNEVTSAHHMLEITREQLFKMVCWYAGIKTEFKVSPGKQGKYLENILEPELWSLYLKSHADAESENIWEAFEAMSALFRTAGRFVAKEFGFEYPLQDDERVTAHMKYVRALPADAVELYPERRR